MLGNLTATNITVEAGKTLDLSKVEWKPVRYGYQVWDIGVANRDSSEFFKGDGKNYWLWGWPLRYPLLFPNDITYTIGKSDYHKDWFFEEVPHSTADTSLWLNPGTPDPANQPFGWVKAQSRDDYPITTGDSGGLWRSFGSGRATTWTIKFNLDKAPKGSATLRVALGGAQGNGGLTIGVNGQEAGRMSFNSTDALRYNTMNTVWQERYLPFDATLLKAGENTMTLTVPAGDVKTGVVYDYLRLELNEFFNVDGSPVATATAAR